MKQFLKRPLFMAVAATLAASMSGNVMAAGAVVGPVADAAYPQGGVTENFLGNVAIVPYYTVKNDYISGIHITNTTAFTQVLKIRYRRASDSADVLDFNIIMSPDDVWTGSISDGSDGDINASGSLFVRTTDNSCTAPAKDSNNNIVASDTNLVGGDEGYIEIIGMGQVDEAAAVNVAMATAALHDDTGMPASCGEVTENFTQANVISLLQTSNDAGGLTDFLPTPPNAFKVSYFVRDAVTGKEFGANANTLNIAPATAMMSHQQAGLVDAETNGYDFPNLDGSGLDGVPTAQVTGLYDLAVRASLANVENDTHINDWSFNADNGVATDWVVTIPGQYLMVDPTATATGTTDVPLRGTLTVFDREEQQDNGLVVSPGTSSLLNLPNEVNVIEWGGESVFSSDNVIGMVTPDLDQSFGFAKLDLESKNVTVLGDPRVVYNLADAANPEVVAAGLLVNETPVIAIAAWERTFTDVAGRDYGRIIEHSRTSNE